MFLEKARPYFDIVWDYFVPGKSVLRSLGKTCTWRIVATTDTFFLGYVVLPWIMGIEPNAAFAGGIALFEVASKMVLYFFHERVWAKVGHRRYPPKTRVRIKCRNCGVHTSKTVEHPLENSTPH